MHMSEAITLFESPVFSEISEREHEAKVLEQAIATKLASRIMHLTLACLGHGS